MTVQFQNNTEEKQARMTLGISKPGKTSIFSKQKSCHVKWNRKMKKLEK